MLSHVSLGTSDAARAAGFYDPVLAAPGIRNLRDPDGNKIEALSFLAE